MTAVHVDPPTITDNPTLPHRIPMVVLNVDGSVDTTTELTFEDIQNGTPATDSTPAVPTVTHTVDPNNNRVVIVTTAIPAGGQAMPYSFRIHATGKLGSTLITGTASPVDDLSGAFWTGEPITSA